MQGQLEHLDTASIFVLVLGPVAMGVLVGALVYYIRSRWPGHRP